MNNEIVVISSETIMAELHSIKEFLKVLDAKIAKVERPDDIIGAEEAMRITKLKKTQLYQYLSEGVLTRYGEGRRPYFSRKECETARFRKNKKHIITKIQ